MMDIVKEIKDCEVVGDVMKRSSYLTSESMISREYFNREVVSRYPNLVFIRILMLKTTEEYMYQDVMREREYSLYSVFIDENVLEYLSTDFKISYLNGEKVIDLRRCYQWKQQVELRNKILMVCPIIMAEYNSYYYMDDFVNEKDIVLSENVSVYPHDYKMTGYQLLNSTNFILISNSKTINQQELDELCLSMLEKLFNENQEFINKEKEIYVSISRKLHMKLPLSEAEISLVQKFIDSEMKRIDGENTILVRSRIRGDEK